MYLEQLIETDVIEDLNLECKARLDRKNVLGWLKSIAGLANAEGGTFFIGVEDKSNKLLGFTRKEADNERNYFNNQVNEHIFPRPTFRISFLRYERNDKELYIIRVDIPESVIKPIIVKFNNIPSIFMRRDGFTNGATYEEIIEMSIQSSKKQYDILSSDLPYDRENFSELFEFYREHNEGKELTDKALMSMGFFDSEKKLKNGAVLFQDAYHEDKTMVQCSMFSGFNKGSERVITVNRYQENITTSIQRMMEFVEQRMNHSFIKKDDTRENVDAYPRRALFEGIINSIAHRDYFMDGTQIQVDLFRDRLEISSPGSFYQGAAIGKTYDLSKVISKRRNELICAVLVRCNVMEAAGTGFDKIMQEYERADEKHKPYILSASDHFTIVLPDLTYEEGINSDANDHFVYPPIAHGSAYDEQILSYCFAKAQKSGEITTHLGISDSSYFRKRVLENLVEQGYLEKEKVGRANYYKTNREMVKRE